MAEIDPKLIKWDDAPAPTVDPKMVRWDAKPDSDFVARAGRVAGLGARAVATGVMGLPLLFGDAINQGINLAGGNRSSVMEGWNSFLTNAGLPEPQTPVERFSTAVTSGMAGGAGQLGAVRNASGPIRDALMQVPGRQIVAGGTGGAAASVAGEMGAGPAGQIAAGIAGGLAPFSPQIAKGLPTPEVQRQNDITNSLRGAIRSPVLGLDEGFSLPPSQAGGGSVNSVLEGKIAGKAPTDRLLSIDNQPKTNLLVKKELGFDKNKALTPDTLDEYRGQQAQAYRDVANLDYERVIAPGKTYTTRQAVKDLSEARRQANLEFDHYKRQRDPAALGRYEAHSARAEEIETFLETAAKAQGKPGLVGDLRKARTKLAQSYAVERALEETGNVDAASLAKDLKNGVPLTGNLRLIAQGARVYPQAFRLPERVGEPAGRDILTTMYGIGGLAGIGGGQVTGSTTMTLAGLFAAGLPLARPATRSLITSNPYQSIMVNPGTPLSRPDAVTLGILSGGY